MARGADGSLWPLSLDGVEIVSDSNQWASGYDLGASDLRIAVGDTQTNRQLKIGQGYHTRGLAGTGHFTIPAVKQGEIKQIPVIITPTDANVAVTTQPTGSVEGKFVDATMKRGLLAVYLKDGVRHTAKVDSTGKFKITGINLGGELMIGEQTKNYAMVYISRVNDEHLNLPRDADVVLSGPAAVIKLRYSAVKLPRDSVGVAIFKSDTSMLPLTWVELKKEQGAIEISNPGVRGWMRIICASGQQFPVRQVNLDQTDVSVDLNTWHKGSW
jgi:hypothetical protein